MEVLTPLWMWLAAMPTRCSCWWNGEPFGSRSAAQCPLKTCVFAHVALRPGKNVIAARGTRGSQTSADEVAWTLADADHVSIAAGQLASGLKASNGTRFGSDNFFSGGTGRKVVHALEARGRRHEPDQGRGRAGRRGPVRDVPGGPLQVRHPAGQRHLPSRARLRRTLEGDGRRWSGVRRRCQRRQGPRWPRRGARGGAYRTVVTRSVPVTVSNGRLELAFTATVGDAHRVEHRHLEAVAAQTRSRLARHASGPASPFARRPSRAKRTAAAEGRPTRRSRGRRGGRRAGSGRRTRLAGAGGHKGSRQELVERFGP